MQNFNAVAGKARLDSHEQDTLDKALVSRSQSGLTKSESTGEFSDISHLNSFV